MIFFFSASFKIVLTIDKKQGEKRKGQKTNRKRFSERQVLFIRSKNRRILINCSRNCPLYNFKFFSIYCLCIIQYHSIYHIYIYTLYFPYEKYGVERNFLGIKSGSIRLIMDRMFESSQNSHVEVLRP